MLCVGPPPASSLGHLGAAAKLQVRGRRVCLRASLSTKNLSNLLHTLPLSVVSALFAPPLPSPTLSLLRDLRLRTPSRVPDPDRLPVEHPSSTEKRFLDSSQVFDLIPKSLSGPPVPEDTGIDPCRRYTDEVPGCLSGVQQCPFRHLAISPPTSSLTTGFRN